MPLPSPRSLLLTLLPLVLSSCLAAPDASATPAQDAGGLDEPTYEEILRSEMEGAPYPRETADTLAVLVPREPGGGRADERARRAFASLSDKEKEDLLEWFTFEARDLGTFQGTLIRYVVDSAEREPESWPELQALEWYDPEVEAPGQPIPRRPLAADYYEVEAVRDRIFHAVGSRRLDSGWMVDYGTRGLVRLPHHGDVWRVFENGLLGMAPDWDLAEALVELALDDGSLQKSFQAFGHAYTDRWGGVYPGVTLYDAHASRLQIEMPDVDTLGIIHDVLGDWETWVAPVHPEQHASLYSQIALLFRDVSRHRGLRTNLARTYLCGSPELRDRYANNLDNFHALWESVASEPERLSPLLPDSENWRSYLQGWHDSLIADPAPFYRGTSRHATLERSAQLVRATLLRLLGEYGAFDRIERMPPFDG